MSLERHLVAHLQETYTTERDYQGYLRDWSGHIRDQQLKASINSEIHDIDGELTNLAHCLNFFNESPSVDSQSPFVQALKQEDQQTMQAMKESGALDMDVHLAMTDTKFANSEVANYQAMLTMARVLHQSDVAKLLEDNLSHEENDLQTIQDILLALIDLSQQQKAA
ncbi:MAG TPA: DUF892 family protein [Armatimonadota bacterium]|nr:DUF892 family protein [Armatimonadota bacterium]